MRCLRFMIEVIADVVKKWYDGYREVLCYGIAFYKKNCKITVKKQKIEL